METVAQENVVLSQNQPILPEQPKQNNFLTILLSILLLLSVSIAGFFAYQTQKLAEELRVLSSESKQKNMSTSESISDPKNNWKNFESKKYEFTFKYPNELILNSPSQTNNFEDSGELDFYVLPNSPVSFNLSAIPSKGTTLDGQIDMVQNYGWSEYNKSNINIHGVSGVMYSGVLDKKQPTRVVIFSNDKYIFKFRTVVFDDGEMLNQILSTFKFIDSDPTADWKTYNMNRIDFKYPQNYFVEPQSSKSDVTIFNKNTDSNRYYISVREIDESLQQLVQTGSINKDLLTDIKISFPEKGFYVAKELKGTASPVGVSETIYLIDQVNSYIEIRFWNNIGTLNSEYELFRKNVELILSSLSFKG